MWHNTIRKLGGIEENPEAWHWIEKEGKRLWPMNDVWSRHLATIFSISRWSSVITYNWADHASALNTTTLSHLQIWQFIRLQRFCTGCAARVSSDGYHVFVTAQYADFTLLSPSMPVRTTQVGLQCMSEVSWVLIFKSRLLWSSCRILTQFIIIGA